MTLSVGASSAWLGPSLKLAGDSPLTGIRVYTRRVERPYSYCALLFLPAASRWLANSVLGVLNIQHPRRLLRSGDSENQTRLIRQSDNLTPSDAM